MPCVYVFVYVCRVCVCVHICARAYVCVHVFSPLALEGEEGEEWAVGFLRVLALDESGGLGEAADLLWSDGLLAREPEGSDFLRFL